MNVSESWFSVSLLTLTCQNLAKSKYAKTEKYNYSLEERIHSNKLTMKVGR